MRLRLLPILLLAIAVPAFADHIPIDVSLRMIGPEFASASTELTYTLELTAVFPGAAYAVIDTLPPSARFVRAGGVPWN